MILDHKNNWALMPANVEKEHNKVIKKRKELTPRDKTLILFSLAAKKDLAGVQWIKNNTNTSNTLQLGRSTITDVHAAMFALHNNNADVAQFLIETDKQQFQDDNWKRHYNNITLPETLKCDQCTNPYDFSILPYLLAVWTDTPQDLEQLCSQKKRSASEQTLLIEHAVSENAIECFNHFLKYHSTKNIIANNFKRLFELACSYQRKEIVHCLFLEFQERTTEELSYILNKSTKIDDVYLFLMNFDIETRKMVIFDTKFPVCLDNYKKPIKPAECACTLL
jgi:hypothetical protein